MFSPPRMPGPLVATVALVALLAAWYAFFLPVGALQHGDEFLTLDRAASFLRHDDWLTVFSNNAPTFKKPPLQYWAIAGLMALGLDLELALRLPSFLFGLGLLGATAWLARIVIPERGWAPPVAVLLLACSERFWEVSLSALLDTGATFFATLALAGAFSAIRRPAHWWIVALACGIGAVQKAPTPLLFAAIPLIVMGVTRRWSGASLRESLQTKHFAGAFFLALVLVAFWPGLQWLRHGAESFREAYMQQMVERFSPFEDAAAASRWSLFTLFADGEPSLRALGLIALAWLPFGGGRREFLGMPVMVGLYALVVSFATGIVSPRYSLLFLPMMMVALAVATVSIPKHPLRQASLLVAVVLLASGPVKSQRQLGMTEEGSSRLIPLIRSVGAAAQPEETLAYCGRSDDGERLYVGALSYYGNVAKTWMPIRKPDQLAAMVSAGAMTPPLRGICATPQFGRLQRFLEGAEIVEESEGFVHWTARGVKE